jgi:poly-beta-hydroxybutyrate-responsive repressor
MDKATKKETLINREKSEKEPKNQETENRNDQLELGFKAFLTPYTLLLLQNTTLHGYELWLRLSTSLPGLSESDRPALYRLLRQLEEEGKLSSHWDSEKSGPARRVYSITHNGKDFLDLWAKGLKQYQNTLDFFFKLYTGGLLPSPFEIRTAEDKMEK